MDPQDAEVLMAIINAPIGSWPAMRSYLIDNCEFSVDQIMAAGQALADLLQDSPPFCRSDFDQLVEERRGGRE